jgi:PAS domain S-box-containing protein
MTTQPSDTGTDVKDVTANFEMDGEGNISQWDSGSEKIFGWSRDEAIGARLSELIIPRRFRGMHEAGLKHYKSTGQGKFVGTTIEISTLHRSGREIPVAITISMERDDRGYRFPTVATVVDPTHPA